MAEEEPEITRRKSGIDENLLRVSEKFMSWGSWEMNMDTEQFSASPQVYEILGWPKDKPFDRQELRNLIHSEDRELILKKYEEALAEKGSIDLEFRIKREDGETRHIRSQANLIKDQEDGSLKLAGIVHDISNLRKKEIDLKEEIEFNKALLDTTSDGYLLISMNSNDILDVNPAYCEMTGYTREELLEKTIDDLDVDFEQKALKEKKNEIINQGAGNFESRHRTKNGEVRHVEISITVVNKGAREFVVAFVRDINERKRAERKLEESEQRFKSLFKHNPLAVFWFDMEGNFMGANEKAVDLSGYTREELMEEGFDSFVAEGDLERNSEYFRSAAEGEPQNFEQKAHNKQGEELFVRTSLFPLYVENEIEGLFGIAEDITEETKAKKALERSEQRFKSLFDQNPNGVYSFDFEGNFLHANRALEELTGYSVNELKEMNFEPLLSEEDREKVWGHFEKAVQGEAQTYEAKGIRKDGSPFYVMVTNLPIYVNGEITGVFGIAQDITGSKETARKLKESEERWHRLVENNPQPIQVVQDGKFVFLNQGGVELYGVDNREDLYGRKVLEFVHPDFKDRIWKRKVKFEKDIHLDSEEVKIIRADGEERFLEVHSIPIQFEGKKAIQTVIHDITERKKQEHIIKKSLNEKEVLLQEIHHRVKNNLAVISGLLELQSMNTDNEALIDTLKESQLRVQSMAMIHEKLYQSEALSDIGFDRYIHEFVETIVRTFGFDEQDVQVRYQMDSVSLQISEAIPSALILNELVVNCFKHAFDGEGGTILIRFKADENLRKLQVYDNGSGLPDDFDIEKNQSLGMSLVQTLTEQLEGELKIDEGLEGSGASFCIQFECVN